MNKASEKLFEYKTFKANIKTYSKSNYSSDTTFNNIELYLSYDDFFQVNENEISYYVKNKWDIWFKMDSIRYKIDKAKSVYFKNDKDYIIPQNIESRHPLFDKIKMTEGSDKINLASFIDNSDSAFLDSNKTEYLITVKRNPKKDKGTGLLNVIYEYTIRKSDYFVTSYSDKFQEYDGYWQYSKVQMNIEKIKKTEFTKQMDLFKNEIENSYTYALFDTLYVRKKHTDTLTIIAPSFKLSSLNGENITNKDHKLIILDFGYIACSPCRVSMPFLEEIYKKYESEGLLVLGVNPYDKDLEYVKKFMVKQKISYPVCLVTKEFAKEYKVYAYPTFYLINGKGEIIYHQEGFEIEEMRKLDNIISQELKK